MGVSLFDFLPQRHRGILPDVYRKAKYFLSGKAPHPKPLPHKEGGASSTTAGLGGSEACENSIDNLSIGRNIFCLIKLPLFQNRMLGGGVGSRDSVVKARRGQGNGDWGFTTETQRAQRFFSRKTGRLQGGACAAIAGGNVFSAIWQSGVGTVRIAMGRDLVFALAGIDRMSVLCPRGKFFRT